MASHGDRFGDFTIDGPLDVGLACKRFAGHGGSTPVVIAILDAPIANTAHATTLHARCQQFAAPGSPHVDEVLACEIVDQRAAIVTRRHRGMRLTDRLASPPDLLPPIPSSAHSLSTSPRVDTRHTRPHPTIAASRELGFADALLGPARLSRILDGILAGLVALHARGIVHGAIHPSTIWLDDTAPQGEIALLGELESTLLYAAHREHLIPPPPIWSTLSPEQVSGRPLTPATDVYSIGALLYELLTGRPLHTGTAFELAANIMVQPIEAISLTRIDLPDALTSLITRCLDHDPARRPTDAFELAARLDEISLVPSGPLRGTPLAFGGYRPAPGDPLPTIPPLDRSKLDPRERDLLAQFADAKTFDVGDASLVDASLVGTSLVDASLVGASLVDATLRRGSSLVDDGNARTVYADWLDEHDDPVRSTFLRLDADDTTHELALRSFARDADLAWRAVVSRARILCRHDATDCPGRWSALAASPQREATKPRGSAERVGAVDAARHCTTCSRTVHYVTTPEAAIAFAKQGHAIAVDATLPMSRARLAYFERRRHDPMPPEYISPPTPAEPLDPEPRPALWRRVRRWLRR